MNTEELLGEAVETISVLCNQIETLHQTIALLNAELTDSRSHMLYQIHFGQTECKTWAHIEPAIPSECCDGRAVFGSLNHARDYLIQNGFVDGDKPTEMVFYGC
jgi:hypothetical protein